MIVHYIHIKARHNGIPLPVGGYTVACVPNDEHGYVAGIAKCPEDRPYVSDKGASVARARLATSNVALPDRAALQAMCNTLSEKVSTGALHVHINLNHVP